MTDLAVKLHASWRRHLVVFAALVALFAAGSAEAEEGRQFPSIPPEVTERVRLRKAGERCEPVMEEWVAIPGRNMKAGSFIFDVRTEYKEHECAEYSDPDGTVHQTCVWPGVEESYYRTSGVLVDNEAIYYPLESYWTGEINFGFHKDYLVMDAWPSGAGHGRMMFLYRLTKEGVELLDAVGGGSFSDFESTRKSEFQPTEYGKSRLTDVADVDGDGNPEINIRMAYGYIFHIYVEIRDGRLRVDLNPKLYKPMFEEAKRSSPGAKTPGYYIYAFLSGELKLDEIAGMIAKDKRHSGRHGELLELLKTADSWDEKLHSDNKFTMTKYDLKGAKCDE